MDRYPMKARLDGRLVRNLRVVATPDRTTVWHWDREQGEAAVLRRTDVAPERVGATERFRVEDLVLEPQKGCGCQHPMYTFVPPAEP